MIKNNKKTVKTTKSSKSVNDFDQEAFNRIKVLIVLGFLAAIFLVKIPIFLIQATEKELKNTWKKDFGSLSQVYLEIVNSSGVNGNFPGDGEGSEDLVKTFLSDLGSVRKKCAGTVLNGGEGNGSSFEGCWHTSGNWNYLNGKKVDLNAYNGGFVFHNGSFITIKQESTNCSEPVGNYVRCGYILVDVNGFNGPNIIGRDIFGLSITRDLLVPFGINGYQDKEQTCIKKSKDKKNTGWGCSAQAFIN